jgi:hypothetical protein
MAFMVAPFGRSSISAGQHFSIPVCQLGTVAFLVLPREVLVLHTRLVVGITERFEVPPADGL